MASAFEREPSRPLPTVSRPRKVRRSPAPERSNPISPRASTSRQRVTAVRQQHAFKKSSRARDGHPHVCRRGPTSTWAPGTLQHSKPRPCDLVSRSEERGGSGRRRPARRVRGVDDQHPLDLPSFADQLPRDRPYLRLRSCRARAKIVAADGPVGPCPVGQESTYAGVRGGRAWLVRISLCRSRRARTPGPRRIRKVDEQPAMVHPVVRARLCESNGQLDHTCQRWQSTDLGRAPIVAALPAGPWILGLDHDHRGADHGATPSHTSPRSRPQFLHPSVRLVGRRDEEVPPGHLRRRLAVNPRPPTTKNAGNRTADNPTTERRFRPRGRRRLAKFGSSATTATNAQGLPPFASKLEPCCGRTQSDTVATVKLPFNVCPPQRSPGDSPVLSIHNGAKAASRNALRILTAECST